MAGRVQWCVTLESRFLRRKEMSGVFVVQSARLQPIFCSDKQHVHTYTMSPGEAVSFHETEGLCSIGALSNVLCKAYI